MISVVNLKRVGEGHCCRCLKLSERLVIKCYKNELRRDVSFANQLLAFMHGVGPEPWGKRLTDLESHPYAYISRRAGQCGTVKQSEWDALYKRMNAIGLSDNDMGYSNAGRIHGRLVCVDFDPISVNRGRCGD